MAALVVDPPSDRVEPLALNATLAIAKPLHIMHPGLTDRRFVAGTRLSATRSAVRDSFAAPVSVIHVCLQINFINCLRLIAILAQSPSLPLRVTARGYFAAAMAVRPLKRVDLRHLLMPEAIAAASSMYETVKQLSMSVVMEEALLFIVSQDVARQEFKNRSEDGDVVQSCGCHRDFGNYLYAVLYHLSMFYACRHSDLIDRLYKQAKERYPTLDMEHEYNYRSLRMQGDVIEVALAIALETRPDMHERNVFMANMRQYTGEFRQILFWMDSERESGEHLKVSLRPPPFQLAKAIVLAPASIQTDDQQLRLRYFSKFMAIANQWRDSVGYAIL